MNKQPAALPERNETLYNDWKSGDYKMWELVTKYKISATRINQIVRREKLLEVIPSLENEETI